MQFLERRNGIARRVYNRLVTDARFSEERILAGEQWRLNAPIPGGRYSA